MASAYPKAGKWYVRYKDERGRWRDRVTSAHTKTEARRLADDLERKCERARLQLDTPGPADETVASLMTWWLEGYSTQTRSHERNTLAVRKHLLESEIAGLPLEQLSTARVEAFLQARAATLAPQSLNHLRNFLGRAFRRAIEVGRWRGENPIARVRKRRIAKRAPDYLRAEEIPPVVAQITPTWRAFFATAIYAGLRAGEIRALRKTDVDIAGRLLTVRSSGTSDTTKGGHGDMLPIAEELAPFLEQAMAASVSEFVFPGLDGEQMDEGKKLTGILRSAMARAGIVAGYVHVCRKRGCTYAEKAQEAQQRRCPVHKVLLWPKAQVRKIRFHDLRHTMVTHLAMRSSNPFALNRLARHKDPRTTTEIYAHAAPGFLKQEVDRLRFGVEPPAVEPARAVANGVTTENRADAVSRATSFAAPVLQDSREGRGHRGGHSPQPHAAERFSVARPAGFEPATPGLEGGLGLPPQSPLASAGSQVVGFSRDAERAQVHGVRREPPNATPFAARFAASSVAPALRPVDGGAGRFLTVRQVADRLAVSTATVYALCARGELEHVRVSNALRISPAALARYLERAGVRR